MTTTLKRENDSTSSSNPRERPGFITGSQAARILDVPLAEVMRLVAQKQLPGLKWGRGCYVNSESVTAFKKSRDAGRALKGEGKGVPENNLQEAQNANPSITGLDVSPTVGGEEAQSSSSIPNSPDTGAPQPPAASSASDSRPIDSGDNGNLDGNSGKVISIVARKGPLPGQKVCLIGDVADAVGVPVTTVQRWAQDNKVQTVQMLADESDPRKQVDDFITTNSLQEFLRRERQTELTLRERTSIPRNVGARVGFF